ALRWPSAGIPPRLPLPLAQPLPAGVAPPSVVRPHAAGPQSLALFRLPAAAIHPETGSRCEATPPVPGGRYSPVLWHRRQRRVVRSAGRDGTAVAPWLLCHACGPPVPL